MFGYSGVRHRGLPKYKSRLNLLAGFTNLLRAERYPVTQVKNACFPPAWRTTGEMKSITRGVMPQA